MCPRLSTPLIDITIRTIVLKTRQNGELKTEWLKTLYPPSRPDKNWSIILPFANTYENAFASMCEIKFHPYHAKKDRLIIFLNGTEEDSEVPAEAVEWV